MRGNKKVLGANASYKNVGSIHFQELIEAGKLKPAIERTYPLEQIAGVHGDVETGRRGGNGTIAVAPRQELNTLEESQ